MHITEYEAFGGILAWHKALVRVTKRHGDTCEIKGYWEIDKYASNAGAAVHELSEDLNMWDITQDQSDLNHSDIFCLSPPCQPYSRAGKNEGSSVDKGNLFWNSLNKIKQIKPKYCIMENVKNLVYEHKEDFKNMLLDLEEIGYHAYYEILNTCDYDVPQNRERVFMVAIRNDLYDAGKRFEFPKPIPQTRVLFDLLEDQVDEKYFLSDAMLENFIYKEKEFKGQFKLKGIDDIAFAITCKEGQTKTGNFVKVNQVGQLNRAKSFNGNAQQDRVYSPYGLSLALNCVTGGGQEPKILIASVTKKGYEIAYKGDAIRVDHPGSKTGRGRVGDKRAMTLSTGDLIAVFDGERVRKLTPLECWRLQDFDDEDYYRAVKAYDRTYGVNKDGSTKSDSQMYKRAGNSITVKVIEEILENLLYDRKQDYSQISLF